MKNKNIVNQLVILFFILFLSFGVGQNARSQSIENSKNSDIEKTENKEELNVGKLIVEHITDSYEWHIISIGKHNLIVPLPVIMYDQGHWTSFWSSRFHQHHGLYKGYFITEKGINQGKIVRLDKSGNEVRPQFDISITRTVAVLFINAFLVIFLFLSIAKTYKTRKGVAPKGLQSAFEPLIIFIRDEVALSSIGKERYERYTPYLLTIFFFIFLSNLLGIIPFFPWGVSITANIAVTGVMAAFTFVITTYSANKHYWKDIFNMPGVPWWLKIPFPLMPIVEIMGIFTKPIVLMIRLFANMLAGHTVIMGFVVLIFIFGKLSLGLGLGVSVVSVSFSIFLDLLEILVALIQAYVFTLLSALYFGMAIEVPEHH